MKKLLFSAAAVLALAASFAYGDSALKDAARRFLNGLAHMDYRAAREVSTRQTKTQLEQLEQMMAMMGDQSKLKDEAEKILVKMKEPEITSDTLATVPYTLSSEPGVVKTLKMVRRNGRWLAEWSKMDGMDAMDEAAPAIDRPSYDGPVDTNSPR